MKILGIDTSTDVLGIAVTEDDHLISEARFVYKRAHAEQLIFAIENLLNLNKLKLPEIEAIAVSIGPGSFTGLRIGLAAIKGMAFEKNIRVVGVSSLEVLAFNGIFWHGKIRPLIRAQADEAYSAVYKIENERLKEMEAPRLVLMTELEEEISDDMLLIISGFRNYKDYLTPSILEKVKVASPQFSMMSGFTVARLGWQKILEQQYEELETLEPFYLKEFKAKRKVGI